MIELSVLEVVVSSAILFVAGVIIGVVIGEGK